MSHDAEYWKNLARLHGEPLEQKLKRTNPELYRLVTRFENWRWACDFLFQHLPSKASGRREDMVRRLIELTDHARADGTLLKLELLQSEWAALVNPPVRPPDRAMLNVKPEPEDSDN